MKLHPFCLGALGLLLLTLRAVGTVYYVDVNSPNPTPPYADWSTAAVTIQTAVNVAANGDLVLVNDGFYQDGFGVNKGTGLPATSETNRVAIGKSLIVQSVNGPAATYISGAGTMRCVFLTNGAALNGFTLMSGTAGYTYSYVQLGRTLQKTVLGSGGGVAGSLAGGVASNCVLTANTATSDGGGADGVTLLACQVTDNSAANGGGAASCTLIDCSVTGNSAIATAGSLPGTSSGGTGGGVYGGTAMNCVIAGNNASVGGGACAVQLENCTIVNNSAGFDGGVSPPSSLSSTLPYYLTNCLVYFNTASTNNNYDKASAGVFDRCCAVPLPAGVENIATDPSLVDLYGGDYHLASNSLLINSGNNGGVSTGADLDGNPRIIGGTVDIGAYEYQTPSSVLSYAWAQQYGLPTDGSADYVDFDGTGMNNWQKWVAGLNPTDPSSVLAMSSAYPHNLEVENWTDVQWQSVNTRTYYLLLGTNLALPSSFSMIQSNLAGEDGTTFFMDTTATNGGPYFYRVGVQW